MTRLSKQPNQALIISLNVAHIADIEALLQGCDLPFEDCRLHLQHFAGIIFGDKLIAIGALQYEDSVALLRSIAVHPESRGQGLAGLMTHYLMEQARTRKVQRLYILTETATAYFSRFGFYPISREAAPAAIRATQQFKSLCPTSAQLMRLDL
jgi:amino-acid N-acetyltransferase